MFEAFLMLKFMDSTESSGHSGIIVTGQDTI